MTVRRFIPSVLTLAAIGGAGFWHFSHVDRYGTRCEDALKSTLNSSQIYSTVEVSGAVIAGNGTVSVTFDTTSTLNAPVRHRGRCEILEAKITNVVIDGNDVPPASWN
jgi:hypothetical protein